MAVLSILVPALVFVIGLLILAMCKPESPPKITELGKAMLWVGLFWTVAVLSHVRLDL